MQAPTPRPAAPVRDLSHLDDPKPELIRTMQALVDKVAHLLEDAKDRAAGQQATILAKELPRALDRLVLQRYWRLWMAGSVLMVALLSLAFWGGYLIGPGPRASCGPYRGGIICQYWMKQPTPEVATK